MLLVMSPAVVASPPSGPSIESESAVVVTGRRVPMPDAQVVASVSKALSASPVLYSEHLWITARDGVVTLHGIVFDDWDLQIARRIAHHTPGVRRVINDTEMKLGGSD